RHRERHDRHAGRARGPGTRAPRHRELELDPINRPLVCVSYDVGGASCLSTSRPGERTLLFELEPREGLVEPAEVGLQPLLARLLGCGRGSAAMTPTATTRAYQPAARRKAAASAYATILATPIPGLLPAIARGAHVESSTGASTTT